METSGLPRHWGQCQHHNSRIHRPLTHCVSENGITPNQKVLKAVAEFPELHSDPILSLSGGSLLPFYQGIL